MNTQFETPSIQELEFSILTLKQRIQQLESDIRSPLEADFSEQASQLSDRLVSSRLLQVERENLAQLQKKLERRIRSVY
jgi:RNA polymerase-binding transcription factor DksA